MSSSMRDIGTSLEAIQHLLLDIRGGMSNKYKWEEDDARITIFNKCSNIFTSLNLAYVLIDKYFGKEDCWKENQHLTMDKNTIENSISEFEIFMRMSLVHNLLFSVENSFRIYVRTLDPYACKKGNVEFKLIYNYLLKKLSLKQYIPLLDFLRNIRNSMHNNGVFMPKNMKNSSVEHEGIIYNFEVGKPTPFISTVFMLKLVPVIIEMASHVIVSPELTDYPVIK